jgi:hypothetical protein
MIEGGVEGVKIYTREWQPAGEPRGMAVIFHGLIAHSGLYEWAAIPSLPRPQAMNIRKAFYGLISITSLGLAPAMPIAAANPAPVSISRDEMVNWLVDGERGLWIQVNTLDWFYARFASGCRGISKTNSIVFETDATGHIDGRSAVTMPGGTRCRLHRLAPSSGPPKNRNADVVPRPQDQG